MKILQKLALITLTASTICSCSNDESDSNFSMYTLLTQIEYTNYDLNEISIFDISYTGYNENGEKVPIVLGEENVYGEPVISKMQATNNTFSLIEYTFVNNQSYLDVDIQTASGNESSESYKINRIDVADEYLVDDDYQIMPDIKYNDGGYRTQWGDYELTVSDGFYYYSQDSDSTTITYEYSLKYNTLGFQQFGIVGAPLYLNLTGCFGKQSKYLLSTVTHNQKGTITTYGFDYTLDSFGNIEQENISRNGDKYIRYIYSYSSALAK